MTTPTDHRSNHESLARETRYFIEHAAAIPVDQTIAVH